MYTHLNRDQQIALGALLYAGHSQASAARELKVDPSTVSRELKRNQTDSGGYHSTHAYVLARQRRKKSKQKYRKIENDPILEKEIETQLTPLRSPEVIAHQLGIVHQTIYSWIDRSRPELKKQLPYRGKKRRRYSGKREQKQGWTRNVHSIAERPETKISWEGDTVKGSTKSQVLTHVERNSLFLVADLMKDGTADSVHQILKQHQKIKGCTTYDRGSEFALWPMIERDTDTRVFFANAHHPWERGKNENTNGRLRRVFPKRFDFSTITQRQLDEVVHVMNHTPRKSLSWQTPAEVFKLLHCTSV
jgi:transposase, IS30 family